MQELACGLPAFPPAEAGAGPGAQGTAVPGIPGLLEADTMRPVAGEEMPPAVVSHRCRAVAAAA